MSIDKTQCSPRSVLTLVGAKTITAATAYKHGIVTVIELGFSDASTNYIKVASNGHLEIGGTNEMGTRKEVSL